MVISRLVRRLLLIAALCLPMQIKPNDSQGGISGFFASLGKGLFGTGTTAYAVGATVGSALLSKTALWLYTMYAAPKVYKYVKSEPETPKVSKGSTGSWLKRSLYTVKDETVDTYRHYRNLLGNAFTTVWNSPTYLKACMNRSLEWDRTDRSNNTQAALELYKQSNGVNSTRNIPSLGKAIISGNKKAVDAYLDSDCGFSAWEYNDGDQGRNSKITGLMLAARFAHKDIAQRFADYGWSINYQDRNGLSALMHASIIPNGIRNAIAAQRTPEAKVKALKTVLKNKTTIVEDLIEKRAKVQSLDKEGRSALMYAARSGIFEATKSIADAMETQRFDINHQDKSGRTALVHAVEGRHVEIVKLLLGRFNAHINKDANNASDAFAVALAIGKPLDEVLTRMTVASLSNQAQWQAAIQNGLNDQDKSTLEDMKLKHLATMPEAFRHAYMTITTIIQLLEKASREDNDNGNILFDESNNSDDDMLMLLTHVNMNKSGEEFEDSSFGSDFVLPQIQQQTDDEVQPLVDAPDANVTLDINQLDAQPTSQPVAVSQHQQNGQAVRPAQANTSRPNRPQVSASAAEQRPATAHNAGNAELFTVWQTNDGQFRSKLTRAQVDSIKAGCAKVGRTVEYTNDDGSISFILPGQEEAHSARFRTLLAQQNTPGQRPVGQ